MSLVCTLFTFASAAPALSKASALTGEVKTPSKRFAENSIRSPSRADHCRENREKQQSKMSNLFLNLLSCSTVLAPCPHRLCRQTSQSRRRPVIAPDAYLGSRFSAARRGVKFIVAQNRTLIAVQKSCTKPSYDKLRRPFEVVTHKLRQYVEGCASI